ncbi:hypothetical protein CE681_04870 [Listeria monocytogenes]|nr:hypothetical protein [Listeria monocytogenes]EAV9986831.1 hypothetical protein [Listeria monocytogenes]
MREYLDSKSQKKVALLEKIFYADNHTSTQEELLNDLNITYPTLISTILVMSDDWGSQVESENNIGICPKNKV